MADIWPNPLALYAGLLHDSAKLTGWMLKSAEIFRILAKVWKSLFWWRIIQKSYSNFWMFSLYGIPAQIGGFEGDVILALTDIPGA